MLDWVLVLSAALLLLVLCCIIQLGIAGLVLRRPTIAIAILSVCLHSYSMHTALTIMAVYIAVATVPRLHYYTTMRKAATAEETLCTTSFL